MIASLLRGYKPNLSPLKDQASFPPGAFSKAPKPTGTFFPKNDPLLSKQPIGTVPFINKPNLNLDIPVVQPDVPVSNLCECLAESHRTLSASKSILWSRSRQLRVLCLS